MKTLYHINSRFKNFIMANGVDIRKIYINTLTGGITAEIADPVNEDSGIYLKEISITDLFLYYFEQLKLYSSFGDIFEVIYSADENRINILKSVAPL